MCIRDSFWVDLQYILSVTRSNQMKLCLFSIILRLCQYYVFKNYNEIIFKCPLALQTYDKRFYTFNCSWTFTGRKLIIWITGKKSIVRIGTVFWYFRPDLTLDWTTWNSEQINLLCTNLLWQICRFIRLTINYDIYSGKIGLNT